MTGENDSRTAARDAFLEKLDTRMARIELQMEQIKDWARQMELMSKSRTRRPVTTQEFDRQNRTTGEHHRAATVDGMQGSAPSGNR